MEIELGLGRGAGREYGQTEGYISVLFMRRSFIVGLVIAATNLRPDFGMQPRCRGTTTGSRLHNCCTWYC